LKEILTQLRTKRLPLSPSSEEHFSYIQNFLSVKMW